MSYLKRLSLQWLLRVRQQSRTVTLVRMRRQAPRPCPRPPRGLRRTPVARRKRRSRATRLRLQLSLPQTPAPLSSPSLRLSQAASTLRLTRGTPRLPRPRRPASPRRKKERRRVPLAAAPRVPNLLMLCPSRPRQRQSPLFLRPCAQPHPSRAKVPRPSCHLWTQTSRGPA